MKDFFTELKRRHVFRIGIAYLVVAWLLTQVVSVVSAPLHLPEWTATFIIVLLAVGFPIALLLTWGFEMTPEGVKRTEQAPKSVKSKAETDAETQTTDSAGPSIAVMPFVNMSSDPEQEYFSDGLSEELLNKLARITGLQVAGRTSSFHFKGLNEDIRTIAEKLGVAHVLEGSVRKSGDKVRITAQLIKADDGYHLWSKTYDRKFDDIFVIQDEIAEAVATALQVTLGVGQFGRIPGMTRNAEAYDEYLKATAFFQQFRPETVTRGVEHLQRAVAIDPTYAAALATLSRAYSVGSSIVPDQAEEWHRKAGDVLERARRISPDSPPVLNVVAIRSTDQGNWIAAGEFYHEKLPALAAKYGAGVGSDQQTGQFHMSVGKVRKAMEFLEAARSADPLNPFIPPFLADAYLDSGNTTAGMAEYDRGATLGGFQLAVRGSGLVAAMGVRDRKLVEKWFALSEEASPGPFNINTILGGFLDDPAGALREIRRLMSTSPTDRDNLSSMVLAYWAAYYGDPDLALALVRRTLESGEMFVQVFAIWRPVFRDMRKLPGFKDLMRDIGLVDYWKKYGWGDFCHSIGDDDFECN
jgi:TolB-like protein/tetratricopeptide (TPR) repeat protein